MDIYVYICKEIAIYNYMDSNAYITNQDIIALLCQRLKENGGEVRGKPDHNQPSRTGSEPEHNAQQFHFASARAGDGTAFVRPAARPARTTDSIETDEQVHTQTSKEKQL